MRTYRYLIGFILFCMLFGLPEVCPAANSPANTYTLDANSDHLIIDHIEYLVESSPLNYRQVSASARDDQWIPLSGRRFHFGDYHPPVWVRFTLVEIPHDNNHRWLLEIGLQLLDYIEVISYNHATDRWSASQRGGNLVPLSSRPIKHHHHLFPITIPQSESITVYIRAQAIHQLNLNIDVWQRSAFWQHDLYRTLLLGLFFGILAIMILYNLVVCLFSKDINYLLYVFYVLSVILYELASTGIGARYIWSESLWLKNNAYFIFAALSFYTSTIFIRYFLSLKSYGGWVLHLNNVFLACWTLACLACLFPLSQIVYSTIVLLALLTPVAGPVTSVYLWYKGNVQAKYYTVAYCFLNIGTVILMLGYTGVLQRSWLTEYSQMIGFVFELTLLALALVDRINRERLARESAQQSALILSQKVAKAREDKLMVQEQILQVQRQANEELELRVLERTNELERAMNNLELANKELSQLSFCDPLTKLYNRRYFEEILANEIKRASRTQLPLSLAIVDIDHFKKVNDAYGHLVGDECLRAVSKALEEQLCRTSDLIARVGGEEFAFLLPATPQDNAMVVACRARTAIQDLNFVYRSQHIELSVSIGVAGWIPERGEQNQKLIKAADQALHQAKKNGRNTALAAGD